MTDLLAYPHGVEFELSVRRPRSATRDHESGFPSIRRRGRRGSEPGEIEPEFLRFGVQFSDGRKATNLGSPFGGLVPRGGQNRRSVTVWAREDEPVGPNLVERGGGGSSGRYDQRYWLWPLPPPGSLTFVCEWPSEHIEETRVDVDSAPILDAAARAVVLWSTEAATDD